MEGGFTGENFVNITGPGHIEQKGSLPLAQARAQIDVHIIRWHCGSSLIDMESDVDVNFFERNLFVFRDRGDGQCDSTAEGGQDQLNGAHIATLRLFAGADK